MEAAQGQGDGALLLLGFHRLAGWRVPRAGDGIGRAGQPTGGGADGADGRQPVLDRQHAAEDHGARVRARGRQAASEVARRRRAQQYRQSGVLAGRRRVESGGARDAPLRRAGAGLRAQSGRWGGGAHHRRAGGRRVRESGRGEDGGPVEGGYFKKLEPILPKSSRVLTTSVVFQRLGKCFLLPVTRKSAPAASAHSRNRLSASSGDAETLRVGMTRTLPRRSRARNRATSLASNLRRG